MKKRFCIDVKQGSSVLSYTNEEKTLCKGSKLVLFIPVVEIATSSQVIPQRQEGFILNKFDFLEMLRSIDLVREDKPQTNKDYFEMSIQSFYNRKQGKPTSQRKFDQLIDGLYNTCICTLEDLINLKPQVVKGNKYKADFVNEYKQSDSGKIGKALECALTGKDKCKKAGLTDWVIYLEEEEAEILGLL